MLVCLDMCTHPAELRFLSCQCVWLWKVQIYGSEMQRWSPENAKSKQGCHLWERMDEDYTRVLWKVSYFGELVLEELPGHAEVTFLADTSKCSCVHRETWLLPRGTWLLLCLDSAAVRAGIREMSSFAVND